MGDLGEISSSSSSTLVFCFELVFTAPSCRTGLNALDDEVGDLSSPITVALALAGDGDEVVSGCLCDAVFSFLPSEWLWWRKADDDDPPLRRVVEVGDDGTEDTLSEYTSSTVALSFPLRDFKGIPLDLSSRVARAEDEEAEPPTEVRVSSLTRFKQVSLEVTLDSCVLDSKRRALDEPRAASLVSSASFDPDGLCADTELLFAAVSVELEFSMLLAPTIRVKPDILAFPNATNASSSVL